MAASPRTGASITAVTNATKNDDADAGSIRYVATVINTPVHMRRASVTL